MQVGVPVVPSTHQLDHRPGAQRAEAVIPQAPHSAVTRSHDFGAQRQPRVPKLRFAPGALAARREGATLETSGGAKLQLGDPGHVKGYASDGRLLVVRVGGVLALSQLIEQPERVFDRSAGKAATCRRADVTNVAKRAAARPLLDEHRPHDRLDLRAGNRALERQWDDLLADIDPKQWQDAETDRGF